jgi:hypothetical protein
MTQRIAVFLRKTAAVNHFRTVLDSFLRVPTLSSAVVTSGFYQEGPAFFASTIFSFPCTKRSTPLLLTFIGVYNGYWVQAFNKFFQNVQNSNCICCVNVSTRSPKGLRWHAKVFIGSIAGSPRMGIIGSSNLTRPAAGTSTPFNYEADVVLWYASDTIVNTAVLEILEPLVQSGEVLVSSYDQDDPLNGGRSLEDHLTALQNEILSSSREA